MAKKYGVNYNKEWIKDPSEQADCGTRQTAIKCYYDEATTVADNDVVYIAKIQVNARFLGLEALAGTLGTVTVQKIAKDGTATTVVAGDKIEAKGVDGGYDLAFVAGATTSASLKLLAKFLLD